MGGSLVLYKRPDTQRKSNNRDILRWKVDTIAEAADLLITLRSSDSLLPTTTHQTTRRYKDGASEQELSF